MTLAEAIYLLCAATSLTAAALLLRQHRARRSPLLFWSFIAFIGLAVNNVLVYIDFSLVQDVSLAFPRTLAGTLGMLALCYGLIWESSE